MKRLMIWSAITLPPTLLIVLSLKPLEIYSIYFFGFWATLFLANLVFVLMSFPCLRAYKPFRRPAVFALCLLISVIVFNWPLRLAYAFSRPAFTQAAAQMAAGESLTTPRRIGWFWIERIDVPESATSDRGDAVLCLWTDDAPGGRTGFVQASPDNLRFNLWSHFKLDETWQFIAED